MSSLKKTAIWITMLAVVLKFSGFLRESIIAKQFGASAYTDGYLFSFSLVTLVVAMVAGGFNNVFLPLYISNRKEQPEATERNASGVMNSILLIFIVLSVVGYFLTPYFLPYLIFGQDPLTEQVAVKITKLFFLFLSIIVLSGVLDSYLQARRIFVPSHISKLLATLMGAIFALLFSDVWGIYSLAYGFIFGTAIGTLIQLVSLLKNNFVWRPTFHVEKEFRRTFITLMIPALLNSVVGQINLFVDKSFATSTVAGAVTFLNNASLIISIPNAIYATTIAAIIFTLLSEQVDQKEKFQDTFFMGMEISLVTLLPITVGLLVVGDAAIAFIYERGAWTADMTQKTYVALVMYLPIIVMQGLQFIVSRSMYAQGRTATVFRISVTTIALNFLLNYLLVQKYSYAGLALASSTVSIYFLVVSAIVVYRGFEKGEVKRLYRLIASIIPPTVIMALPVYGLKAWTPIGSMYSLVQLAILVPIGVILYTVSLRIFYREGFDRLLGLLKRKKRA